jgi:hypothetical protein
MQAEHGTRPQATPRELSWKMTICEKSVSGSGSILNRPTDGFIPFFAHLVDLIPDRLNIITEVVEVSGSQAVDEDSRRRCLNALHAEDLLAGHRIEGGERDTRTQLTCLHVRSTTRRGHGSTK